MIISKNSRNLSFFSWKNLCLLILLISLWLKLLDVAVYKIASRWQLFFNYYDGYRLPASVTAFIPFVRETIRKDKTAMIIIFPGDSTSGGLLYHHSQAIPAYLNQFLPDTHVYNLALSGAHLSEQYLLIKELINEADSVIFPVHYSFFTGRGEDNSYISHPEMVDFLDNISAADLELLGLKPRRQETVLAEKLISKFWYSYRVRRLIPYIMLGKPTKVWLRESLFTDRDQRPQKVATTRKEILEQNQILWQRIKFITEDNVNLAYLKKIGELKQKTGKKFLAYFVPLDLITLETNKIIDWGIYYQIIGKAKLTLDSYDIEYIDFNENNPANLTATDFYNPDHLLPAGNYKAARVLAEKLKDDF